MEKEILPIERIAELRLAYIKRLEERIEQLEKERHVVWAESLRIDDLDGEWTLFTSTDEGTETIAVLPYDSWLEVDHELLQYLIDSIQEAAGVSEVSA